MKKDIDNLEARLTEAEDIILSLQIIIGNLCYALAEKDSGLGMEVLKRIGFDANKIESEYSALSGANDFIDYTRNNLLGILGKQNS